MCLAALTFKLSLCHDQCYLKKGWAKSLSVIIISTLYIMIILSINFRSFMVVMYLYKSNSESALHFFNTCYYPNLYYKKSLARAHKTHVSLNICRSIARYGLVWLTD